MATPSACRTNAHRTTDAVYRLAALGCPRLSVPRAGRTPVRADARSTIRQYLLITYIYRTGDPGMTPALVPGMAVVDAAGA
jgi:hypothetical protein